MNLLKLIFKRVFIFILALTLLEQFGFIKITDKTKNIILNYKKSAKKKALSKLEEVVQEGKKNVDQQRNKLRTENVEKSLQKTQQKIKSSKFIKDIKKQIN